MPSHLLGIGLTDSAELWRYPCEAGPPLGVRFANVPGGDDPAAGPHHAKARLRPRGRRELPGTAQYASIPATGPVDREAVAGQMEHRDEGGSRQPSSSPGCIENERGCLYWAHVRGDLFSRLISA